ncbi:MAG TPA: hypothetical protein VGH54_05530 [Mycobacterium sp.]|jgi:hypothetical protein|uniref:hypothetical protein n=1 Tax=Mycobacterium sp. TaxID=1785 RepID=UPI002F41CE1D
MTPTEPRTDQVVADTQYRGVGAAQTPSGGQWSCDTHSRSAAAGSNLPGFSS